MGLFTKEIRDYKVMEKYKKKLDDFYIFGETDKYNLFLDKRLKQYILRQEKQNPKNVVYLGWLRGEICIYNDMIFYINKLSNTGRVENPLNFINVNTGEAGCLSILSNQGSFIAMHWHCQDVVRKMYVEDEVLTLEIARYKADTHNEEELEYKLYITFVDGQFQVRKDI